jgi:hypothetical protein
MVLAVAVQEKSRVSAYGDAKYCVDRLNRKDIIFFSHTYTGIIAAAEVIGHARNDGPNQRYRNVKFLTPIPTRQVVIARHMAFGRVSEITVGFYWAATVKVPYLNPDEAQTLLVAVKEVLIRGTPHSGDSG